MFFLKTLDFPAEKGQHEICLPPHNSFGGQKLSKLYFYAVNLNLSCIFQIVICVDKKKNWECLLPVGGKAVWQSSVEPGTQHSSWGHIGPANHS